MNEKINLSSLMLFKTQQFTDTHAPYNTSSRTYLNTLHPCIIRNMVFYSDVGFFQCLSVICLHDRTKCVYMIGNCSYETLKCMDPPLS